MSDSFARRYAGTGPWEEVWFLEVSCGPGRGLWLRWVITRGAVSEAATWAVVFRDGEVLAHRDPFPLADLVGGDGFGRREPSIVLARDRAVGRAGPVRWDLHLVDLGRRHGLVPSKIERLGIGRHYVPAIADLSARGTVDVGGETWALDGARGVLGHIYGARNRLRGWAWAHCSTFEGTDALFEGLSARLGTERLATPPLTTLALHVDGQRYTFDRVREMVSVRSRFGGDRWSFEARRGPVHLSGEATLPARPARVRYVDPDGVDAWCANSRLSALRVHLRDADRAIDRELRSGEAAFEVGGRRPFPDPVDAG